MTDRETPRLSIIIPIFNEEEGLPELCRRVVAETEKTGESFELIFCNDGSRDRSEEIILDASRRDPRIKLLSLSRNFGHHPAVQAGLEHCSGDAVILMDGDFQDPPEMIGDLVRKWREGYEVVFTKKIARDDPPLRRFFFGYFYSVFNWFSHTPVETGVGVFSLMDRKAVNSILSMPENSKYFAGMRQWVGFRQCRLDYERPQRTHGQAKQTLSKLFRLAMDGIFSFSHLPIRLVWMLGAVGILLSFGGIVYALLDKLYYKTALLGWTSLITAILFLGSVQLLGIGVVGEYLVRIFDEVKQRPYYIVSRTHGIDKRPGTPQRGA